MWERSTYPGKFRDFREASYKHPRMYDGGLSYFMGEYRDADDLLLNMDHYLRETAGKVTDILLRCDGRTATIALAPEQPTRWNSAETKALKRSWSSHDPTA